ncbi:NAD(P)/FAD-dependent oxidoreductase [Aliikangiella maris]|uniref:NAD(P)/FAD-dependent oxidoreductase n=2 Tax=Aliikangiella maris TaxID=3162458 RepID=A0ABV3MKC4_9GAMM
MPEHFEVIIIGAGAAGLMCAATAAKRGKKVIVLDHANKMAKKVLMSGGGRCNFTNLSIEADNFISNNPHFCKSALKRYTQWDFIALVEKYHIDYYEKTQGQLFCRESSKLIRDLLSQECQSNGAQIRLKCEILSVETVLSSSQTDTFKAIETIKSESAKDLNLTAKNQIGSSNQNTTFKLTTSLGAFTCESLVIATGGLSIPTMGATDFGYQIAQQFGHQVLPTRAGLTPLTFKGRLLNAFKEMAGNALQVQVSCGQQTFNEAILFTHKGLSGPAILQISNYWQPGQAISINLLPHVDIATWITQLKESRPDIQLKTALASHFSQAVASFFASEVGFQGKLKQLTPQHIENIVQTLSDWTIYPEGVEGYRVAEVTLGGVDTQQISSKTFESALQSGLYFIGEVLDVTGHLGGYNFQWAWASGHAAGNYV